eukprot:m.144761 g.144761  ORF g.144761 m.144761 type:complete len:241 (+) comp16049_c1_seq7:563-1285(+)
MVTVSVASPYASVPRLELRLYGVASALFFCACAWAQVNDPDPELWIAFYLLCGSATALVSCLVLGFEPSPADLASKRPHTLATGLALLLCAAGFLVSSLAVAFLVAVVLEQLQHPNLETAETPTVPALPTSVSAAKASLWAILEFEEGRELAGSFILAIHNGILCVLLRKAMRHQHTPAKKQHKVENEAESISVLLISGMLVLLAVAVYAWIYYQPLMNAKYNTPHCNGAFDPAQFLHHE